MAAKKPKKQQKPVLKHLLDCAQYILETEAEDYARWCAEEGLDPANLAQNQHIYTSAMRAFRLKWQ